MPWQGPLCSMHTYHRHSAVSGTHGKACMTPGGATGGTPTSSLLAIETPPSRVDGRCNALRSFCMSTGDHKRRLSREQIYTSGERLQHGCHPVTCQEDHEQQDDTRTVSKCHLCVSMEQRGLRSSLQPAVASIVQRLHMNTSTLTTACKSSFWPSERR